MSIKISIIDYVHATEMGNQIFLGADA